MKKQYAVLGLGSFGRSVALTLESLGCDVFVVDKSYEKVQEISDLVAYAMRADVSDPDALVSLGGKNLDGAVVAVSENLEASIMATIAAKEIGIPYVLAKARDELQGRILEKIGADAYTRSGIWEAGWQRAWFQLHSQTGSSFHQNIVWQRL